MTTPLLEGMRRAASDDTNWGHHEQADYLRRGAEEIERLSMPPAPIRIDFHLYQHPSTPDQDPRMDQVLDLLQQLLTIGKQNMATLQDITDAVAAEKTVIDSVVVLLQKIETDLAAAIAAQDPAAMQAVVDMIHANSDALSAAVVAGTPADPVPTP